MHALVVENEVLVDNQDVHVLDEIVPKVAAVILDSVTIYRPDHIFNSLFFSKTNSLLLQTCEYVAASNNLLVGLKSLQSLQIIGKFYTLGDNFFAPVSSQLHYLVINAQMKFTADKPLFGRVEMPQLLELNLNTNHIEGTLTSDFLQGAPNLKYLYMQNCHISGVSYNFFASFNENLVFLDLSHNNIKQIEGLDDNALHLNAIMNLNYNAWFCSCDVYSMLLKLNSNQNMFIEGPFCSTPIELQGDCFADLANFCQNAATTQQAIILDTFETHRVEAASESKATDSMEVNVTFPISEYEFALELQDNFTVKVIVQFPDCQRQLSVIWFATLKSERQINEPISYQCMQYLPPFTVTCALEADTTYTFCIISNEEAGIAPFNCLPFYVPPLWKEEDIWISEEYKNITLCIVGGLLMSSLCFGSIIAYCTIKMCPSVLEGSKKVLLVKSDEQKRISTISNFVGKQADTAGNSEKIVSR